MKITRIEPILIRTPMDLGGTAPKAGGAPKSDIYTLLVKVETDAGITGWGEAFSNAGWFATRTAVEQVVGPRCIGRDALQIPQLMDDLHHGLYNTGRSGPTPYAISGIEIALWDIAGKAAGVPVHRLLGGASRTSLPAYASLLRYGDAATVGKQTTQAIERGYKLIKLHENVTEIVRASRKAAGDRIPIMLDCSCPWTVDQAIAASRELEDLNLTWLEEPLYPPDDHAGLARLRSVSRIPVAAGENCSNLMEFKRLMDIGALSYAQPSVTKIGLSELRKVFALGEAFGVTVIPHSPYFGPGLLASIHVCAAMPREVWIERYYCDFAETPFGDQINPKEGMIAVPQEPGLGRDPDMSVIERTRVA